MNIASGARRPKNLPALSGTHRIFRAFLNAKRGAVALLLMCVAHAALAAPYLYVADYSGCTATPPGFTTATAFSYGCVSVVDTATSSVVATIPNAQLATTVAPILPAVVGIGMSPIGMAITPPGSAIGPFVYVVNSYGDSTNTSDTSYNKPGTVSVIDARPGSSTLNTVIGAVTVGVKPQLMVINASGTTGYVANGSSSSISVIDLTNLPASGTAAPTINFPSGNQPVGIALTPDGTKAYVTLANNQQVAVVDLASSSVTTMIPLSQSNPIAIAIDPAGKYAYVTDFAQAEYVVPSGFVSVIDLSTNTEVSTIAVGNGPEGIAMTPDGSKVCVTNYVDGTVSVIDTSLAVSSPTTAVTATINVGTASAPLGITIDSNGAFAYVSDSANEVVVTIDLATNALWPLSTSTIAVATDPTYSVLTTSSASSYVNINQHGLTGSWYDPTVGGQGFIINSVPDTDSSGDGTLFAGWFTWDVTVAGGQRWYVLQGPATSSNPVASLGIYTSASAGNFLAPPDVQTVQVGTATMQFSDCNHGLLTYTFTDGSGRQGFIPLLRINGGATCSAAGDSGDATNGDQNSGSWYTTDASGQGLVLSVNSSSSGATLSGGWFTYAPNGGTQSSAAASQNWFVMQGSQAGQGGVYSAPIYSSSGGVFMNPSDTVTSTAVGTMTANFTSCTTMSLTYSFTSGANQGLNNNAAPLSMVRLGPPPPGCQ